MPIDQPEPTGDLVAALTAGEVVLFAGAGIAAEAGFPLYTEALGLDIDRLAHNEEQDSWTALCRQLDAGEVELTAELLRSRIGQDGIRDALRLAVTPHANPQTPTLDALSRLPFAGAITDDWYGVIADRLGHGALLLAPSQSGAATEVLRSGRRFLLEAYGRRLGWCSERWAAGSRDEIARNFPTLSSIWKRFGAANRSRAQQICAAHRSPSGLGERRQ